MTGDDIRNAIRGKGLNMQQAADMLDINRTTLYHKLNDATLDADFVRDVQEKLGINLNAPERNTHTVAVAEKVVDNVKMKFQTVPLKEKRIMELWVPTDFSKSDMASFKKWLEYFESTL